MPITVSVACFEISDPTVDRAAFKGDVLSAPFCSGILRLGRDESSPNPNTPIPNRWSVPFVVPPSPSSASYMLLGVTATWPLEVVILSPGQAIDNTGAEGISEITLHDIPRLLIPSQSGMTNHRVRAVRAGDRIHFRASVAA